ncbi:MAG: hypothetical protein ACTHM1_11130 [Solirubrobacteraceae bacterium]
MTMRTTFRLLIAALLGVAVALLVSCGGSGKGLIPEANAGPLRNDFEAVAQAAESGNGGCTHTEAALGKTEKDFLALPAAVDARLRDKLRAGIANLRQRALAMCAESVPTATTATTPTTTTTETTPTQTTPTTPATPTTPTEPSNEGGGTPAPHQEEGEGSGGGKAKGKGKGDQEEEGGESESGGASAGGAGPGGGR